MPPRIDERSLGLRLLSSLGGAGLALALALVAAHYYSPPNLNGVARDSPWLEPDFGFALTSSLVALGVARYAGRALAETRVFGAVLVRALLWIALTSVFAAAWANFVSLLTLLIAPSHAFACIRLVALGRAFRAERLFRK